MSQVGGELDAYDGSLLRMLRILHNCPQLEQLGLSSTWYVHICQDDAKNVTMSKQICLDLSLREHVRNAVAHIDQNNPSIISAHHERHFVEVEVGNFLHAPATGLGRGSHRVTNILAKFLLLVVDYDVLAGVPHGGQESTVIKLDDFVNELLCHISNWIQVQ